MGEGESTLGGAAFSLSFWVVLIFLLFPVGWCPNRPRRGSKNRKAPYKNIQNKFLSANPTRKGSPNTKTVKRPGQKGGGKGRGGRGGEGEGREGEGGEEGPCQSESLSAARGTCKPETSKSSSHTNQTRASKLLQAHEPRNLQILQTSSCTSSSQSREQGASRENPI